MTNNEKDTYLERALRQAKASLELEGFNITDTHTELVRSLLSSAITEEEYREKVMKMVKGNDD
ncbi:hypothetical protein [Bacillus massiliigorillae]|uniref:hypothetical protein n=1 Tax=Bacillus massiliigorillae TaxID=1243664 RepID=UPI0003A06076|nr:hypothetical protein [Bacillus massiliigorillae]